MPLRSGPGDLRVRQRDGRGHPPRRDRTPRRSSGSAGTTGSSRRSCPSPARPIRPSRSRWKARTASCRSASRPKAPSPIPSAAGSSCATAHPRSSCPATRFGSSSSPRGEFGSTRPLAGSSRWSGTLTRRSGRRFARRAKVLDRRLLFRLLHRMDAVEEIGSGIRRIRELCREHGVAEPMIETSERWVTTTFRRPETGMAGESGGSGDGRSSGTGESESNEERPDSACRE